MSAVLIHAEVVKDAQGFVLIGPLDGPSRYRVEQYPDYSVVLKPLDAPHEIAPASALSGSGERTG